MRSTIVSLSLLLVCAIEQAAIDRDTALCSLVESALRLLFSLIWQNHRHWYTPLLPVCRTGVRRFQGTSASGWVFREAPAFFSRFWLQDIQTPPGQLHLKILNLHQPHSKRTNTDILDLHQPHGQNVRYTVCHLHEALAPLVASPHAGETPAHPGDAGMCTVPAHQEHSSTTMCRPGRNASSLVKVWYKQRSTDECARRGSSWDRFLKIFND